MGRRGFTLVEILIVIGLCGLLLTLSFPALTRFKRTISLEATVHAAAADLRKAQSLAMGRNENTAGGIAHFAFSRTGAASPGGTGTQIFGKRKLILSPAGRVRIE